MLDKTGRHPGKPAVWCCRSTLRSTVSTSAAPALAAAAEQYSEHPLARDRRRRTRRGIRRSRRTSPARAGRRRRDGCGADHSRRRRESVTEIRPGRERTSKDRCAGRGVARARRRLEPLSRPLGLVDRRDKTRWTPSGTPPHGIEDGAADGRNEATARSSSVVGIDDVIATSNRVRRPLMTQGRRPVHRVAMVGDGVNDARGAGDGGPGDRDRLGSDVAKETGGIVLVSGSLRGIAMRDSPLSATMRKIRQNLFFAFIYNVLAIPPGGARTAEPAHRRGRDGAVGRDRDRQRARSARGDRLQRRAAVAGARRRNIPPFRLLGGRGKLLVSSFDPAFKCRCSPGRRCARESAAPGRLALFWESRAYDH